MFDSDPEHERLLLIQTPLSYKLNPTTPATFTRQNSVVAEVSGVTKRIRLVGETEGLDDLLLSAVDETLKPVFRKEGTEAIYDYLENNSQLKRQEIAERPEVFSAGLETLMISAAPVIEKLILKNLYCKLGLRFREKEGYEFSDYIKQFTQWRADRR